MHLKKSPLDAWWYIQGSGRTELYENSNLEWLLRTHIREQFEWRRDVAAKPCFLAKECQCCGCSTPSLFFADKPCSVSKDPYCQNQGMTQCYPKMMGRKEWNEFKKKLK